MELAAAAAKVLSCPLVLLCLLSVCLCSGRQESASPCFSFKVERSDSGQWRYEVQGLLIGHNFLIYKDNNCHTIGDLGNIVNDTKICEKQVDTLKPGVAVFKGMLLDILKTNPITEPLTLHARLCCHYEGDKRFRGSWVFCLNGRIMFHVDLSTGNWTELDPRFKKIIEIWKNDSDIVAFLNKTSQGDCRTCLAEVKSHRKEHPEPTEATIKNQDRIQHTSNSTLVIAGSVLAAIIFVGLIILGVYFYVSRHSRKRKIDVPSSSPSLLGDSLALTETSSANEADEFLTASQNSVLLTLDHTGGNP